MTFLFDTICDDIIEVIVHEKNKIVKKKNKKNHSILLNPVLWDIKMLFYGPRDYGFDDDIPIDLYYEYLYCEEYDENGYLIDLIYDKEYSPFYNKPHIKKKYKNLKFDRGDIERGGVLNPTYKEINIHHIPMDYAFESEQKYYLHDELCEKIKCIN